VRSAAKRSGCTLDAGTSPSHRPAGPLTVTWGSYDPVVERRLEHSPEAERYDKVDVWERWRVTDAHGSLVGFVAEQARGEHPCGKSR
jgi:hypothetical protein